MLVDHQVKRSVIAIAPARVQNGRAASAATDNSDAVDRRLALGIVKIVCEPDHFMPSLHELRHVPQRDSFRATGEWILRVAPVQHEKPQHLHPGNPSN